MIIEKTILCKLNQIKISDKQLFDSLQSSSQLCPHCGARRCCKPHGSYERTMISILNGSRNDQALTVLRVMCSSCKKTHALLSDALIPFGSYSLRFILHVLKAYLARTRSVEILCGSFHIAISTLYKWIHLFNQHANLLLTALEQSSWLSPSSLQFIESLVSMPSFFFLRFRFSFLQNHKRPAITSGFG